MKSADAGDESAEPEGRRLDLPGQFLAIVGLGGFALAAIEGSHWGWTTPLILTLVVSALATIAFLWVETRTPGPLLPLSFFGASLFSLRRWRSQA
jgi:MFS transporter, DHA2 family, methylenomycin A resistance protein